MGTALQVEDLSLRLTRLILAKPVLCSSFSTEVARALAPMLASSAWIPSQLMVPSASGYRRECLYNDPAGLFTIACLTWAPGQATPIHDHASWDVFGVVEGALRGETFDADASGSLARRGADEFLGCGGVTAVDPYDFGLPDIHRMSSATSEVTVSIHIIGCGLSEINRSRYDIPAG